MSRSYKQPYTKSKRFDKTCRCNGDCGYCRDNRLYQSNKQITLDEEIKLMEKEEILYTEEEITNKYKHLIKFLKYIEGNTTDDYIAWRIKGYFKEEENGD